MENLLIDRCVFRYCIDGVVIAAKGDGNPSSETLASAITVRNCVFEGGWWVLPVRSKPSGGVYAGTATFTDTTLTDSTASFPQLKQYTTIRLLHQQAAGTTTEAGQTYFKDMNAPAPFMQLGIVPGDIVRTEEPQKKFAIVTGIESAQTVRIEEWLDDMTRQPAPPPANGTPYRLFHVFLGRREGTVANTPTTITVERWHDLDGRTITGAILTNLHTSSHPLTYEVLPDRPNYLLHAEYNARDIRVLNNVFRRGWSDQCSIYGDRALISGNDLRDGQDIGITSNGQRGGAGGHTIISNNVVRHHGVTGIFSTGEATLIANNVLSRNTWVNHVNLFSCGDIVVGGPHPLISGNLCDGESKPLARYGIVLGSTANPVVLDNTCRRHTRTNGGAGIHCYQEGSIGPNGMKVWNNDVSEETIGLKHTNVPTGGDYQLVGTADPNTTGGILAAPGSLYRRTSGGPPFLYVKESPANVTTGWIGK